MLKRATKTTDRYDFEAVFHPFRWEIAVKFQYVNGMFGATDFRVAILCFSAEITRYNFERDVHLNPKTD